MPTFVHAPLLWGLLLVGVPALIHLINLMHQRRVAWAAMEFLLVSQRKNHTWVRLKELLLLLLRTLIVALVVLVVAQPLMRDELGALLGGSKTHHIVLIDDSYSMSDRQDGGSVMDEAKKVVDRIATVAAERVDSHRMTLLRFSHASRVGRQTQADYFDEQIDEGFVERLRMTLAKIEPSQRTDGPGEALKAVGQLLGENDDQKCIVYLVSDFRTNQWDKPEELRTLLAELTAKDITLRLINCVDRQRDNLAITRLAPISGTKAAGISIFMEVEVCNYGTLPARKVSVILDEEGHYQPAVTIDEIGPGESVTERFQLSFATAGQHRLAARLESDAVELDNIHYTVVDIALEVPVLVIDGSPDGQGSLFLSSALSPGGSVRTGIGPRIETPAFLNTHPLDGYRVIYLTDVERLDASAVKSLEQFVANGGALAVFLGPECRSSFLNRRFWREDQGLMPVPVTGEAELLIDRLERVPDLVVSDHPVFHVLSGKDNGFLPMINVRRYFAVDENWQADADRPVHVLAKLRNGAPLVVERSFGKGRVIAWLTTAAPIWNNAGTNPAFPVIIQEMQAYLASRKDNDALLVGEPITVNLDRSRYQSHVRFVAPSKDGHDISAADAVASADGSLRAELSATERAGIYEIQLTTTTGAEETRRKAVNVDTLEGNLARLNSTQLATRLNGLNYTYHESKAFEADQYESAGYNLSDALLCLLVITLVGEQFLAWSCSYHPSPTETRPTGRGGAA